MTIIKGAPALELAVSRTLAAGLNAEIDALNAAWADGITVNYPAEILTGYRKLIAEYPAVVVNFGLRGEVTSDMAPTYQTLVHHGTVTWISRSSDVHILDQEVKRGAVAIWQTLLKQPGLDGSLAGLTQLSLRSYEQSQIFKNGQSTLLMQAIEWSVAAEMAESA